MNEDIKSNINITMNELKLIIVNFNSKDVFVKKYNSQAVNKTKIEIITTFLNNVFKGLEIISKTFAETISLLKIKDLLIFLLVTLIIGYIYIC